MKRTLLFVLALAVIPVGVDAQVTPSASCAALSVESPLDDVLLCAEQGNVYAQGTLGFKYSIGYGVPEDDVEAVRWYRLAAEQGHSSAQLNLGSAYNLGRGVPEDHVLAYMWANLSAAHGNEYAEGNKNIVEQQMTSEQIAEAQRLSREWLEAHPPGAD
jgi:TPR repeat protein